MDCDSPDKEIVHRWGKFKGLMTKQKGWLKRRAASKQPRAVGALHGTQERSMTTRVGNWLSSGIVKKSVFRHLAWGA